MNGTKIKILMSRLAGEQDPLDPGKGMWNITEMQSIAMFGGNEPEEPPLADWACTNQSCTNNGCATSSTNYNNICTNNQCTGNGNRVCT